MNHVDRMLPEERTETKDPPRVPRSVHVEACRADAFLFECADQRIFPREQVRNMARDACFVRETGVEREQPFRAARAESFDEPKHASRLLRFARGSCATRGKTHGGR
jgi:hypothetical protein